VSVPRFLTVWAVIIVFCAGFWLLAGWGVASAIGASKHCETTACLHRALRWNVQQRHMLEKRLAIKLRPTVDYGCRLGYAAFGVPVAHCKKVVGCESGGDPNQVTPPYGASGYSQFLPSTFRGTPFGRIGFTAFDPVASILAMDQIAARQGFNTSYGWAASHHCHRLSGPEAS
jgi:hypothetical protein